MIMIYSQYLIKKFSSDFSFSLESSNFIRFKLSEYFIQYKNIRKIFLYNIKIFNQYYKMDNTQRIAILQEIIKTNIILDIFGTIFFSCFIPEYLFLIPFLLLSYYGNKTKNSYILTMYQIKIIVSIYVNIYLFYAERQLWIKVSFMTYSPILFWYLNTVWTLCFFLRLEGSRLDTILFDESDT